MFSTSTPLTSETAADLRAAFYEQIRITSTFTIWALRAVKDTMKVCPTPAYI